MSVLYSILKPVVRCFVRGRANGDMAYESFVKSSHEIQAKFRLELPKIKGCEFHDETIDGWHVLVGGKIGVSHRRALLYLVGGGGRRWQLPNQKSMARYICESNRELWIPLYPLYPDYTYLDDMDMLSKVYEKMLKCYQPEDIAWLGFSSGANLGKYFNQTGNALPMLGLMIPVSCCNLYRSEESKARMKEIAGRDIMMTADYMEPFADYYNHDGNVPRYLLGCAAEDDYTGFPKIRMYYGGDEIFSAEAPEYEKAFRRCGLKDYKIHVEPGLFHAYPMFPFLKEGKQGEDAIIQELK